VDRGKASDQRKRRRSVRLTHLEENVSEATLLRAIRCGELPAYRLGLRTLMVDTTDFDRWWQAKRYKPPRSTARRVEAATRT
jgi:excisionase family DNA binding protein